MVTTASRRNSGGGSGRGVLGNRVSVEGIPNRPTSDTDTITAEYVVLVIRIFGAHVVVEFEVLGGPQGHVGILLRFRIHLGFEAMSAVVLRMVGIATRHHIRSEDTSRTP